MNTFVLLALLAVDGGLPDAGIVDAGTPDAGPAKWSWVRAADGGWFDDQGTSDKLVLRVGEVAEIALDLPIMLMQCDEQLLSMEPTLKTLLLKGEKAGKTHCGFWYQRGPIPSRYFEVTVTK